MTASVTQKLAEWVVNARYEDIPAIAIERTRERVLDSLGVQFGGVTTPTGERLVAWINAQEAKPECVITGSALKTTASLAAFANGVFGHALEFDETAAYSSHPASPLTAAALAVGERLNASGRDMILAWLVGWEVTSQAMRVGSGPTGNEIMTRGWFNQGFQPALGCAAVAAKLMGFDVLQTRMALGNAAAAMAGVMKNRASDTKPFIAGNAAMHGVMAAELVSHGFTANENIFDGEDGVVRMIGSRGVAQEKLLENLGNWDMATYGSTIKRYASCAAGHWAQDAMRNLVAKHKLKPDAIETIDVYINGFLMPNMPFHNPENAMQARYSLQFDVAAVALFGKAGKAEYTDAIVRGPEAQAMMKRITHHPETGGVGPGHLGSRVVVKQKNGEVVEETVNILRGSAKDPMSWGEIVEKFNDTASDVAPQAQRARVIDLCAKLDQLKSVRELTGAIGRSA
jgi:2-methylcitrate dehydratase PrpD